MATAETISRPHDRHSRRRHFTAIMKRLTSLKNPSDSGPSAIGKGKKSAAKNNPYPASGRIENLEMQTNGTDGMSTCTPLSRSISDGSYSENRLSFADSRDEQHYLANGNKSIAPTVSTKADTTHSDGQSKAGTVNTAGGALSAHVNGGEGSTFSSPAPSVRSLTTTLTTIQSAAPANVVAGPANNTPHHQTQHSQHSMHFTHQFPSSPPASAIPSHITGSGGPGNPTTYTAATANNLLTDNASILTLASSSKRRRRNSLDTNASVRALAPSSVFGGSRESLPLSVLSGPAPDSSSGIPTIPGRPSVGLSAAERASVYSSSGVVPALTSDRNSHYTNRQPNTGDGASVRSGLAGHGRTDSVTGSIGGTASPLTSPREAATPKLTRNDSLLGEGDE